MSSLYKKNKKFYLLLILPALLLYSFAMLAPLFGGTIPYSFLKWNLMSGKKAFVGFDNYVKLFSDAKFWTSFGFNLFVGAFTIIGSNVFGFILAYFLNENIKAKGVIRAMFFIPNIVSAVLVSFIWVFIFTNAMPALGGVLGWDWLANISCFGESYLRGLFFNGNCDDHCGFHLAEHWFLDDHLYRRSSDYSEGCYGVC